MEQNPIAHESAFAPEAATDEPASSNNPAPKDILAFDPVPVRRRIDGWSPEKQRDYVEALADTGVARQAAAMVGMTEQSASRLRRRADARSFDRTCEAAMRVGARRLVSVAFERAIEGTIKQHFYHGELKGEERVYDNRLLIALLGKLGPLLSPPEETDDVLRNWEPWMEAVEQGLPEPPPPPESEPEPIEAEDEEEEYDDDDDDDDEDGEQVWKDEEFGVWWTRFPPPHDFDGWEHGVWGEDGYQRTLTPKEQGAVDAEAEEESEQEFARHCRRRDRYFGFKGAEAEAEVFEPMDAELSETYEPSTPGPSSSRHSGLDPESTSLGADQEEGGCRIMSGMTNWPHLSPHSGPDPESTFSPASPPEEPNPEPSPHIPRIRLL
jgi:hypothetical protein